MCLGLRALIAMAHIRLLQLSAQSDACCVLFARSIAAIILMLSATEIRAGEHAARYLATMSFVGQPDGRDPARSHILPDEGSPVQMVANYQPPLGYFLDELPADFDVSKAPSEAKDVAIVRVRAASSADLARSNGIRPEPGPTELPRDRLFARIRIVEIRNGSGSVVVGNDYNIYFGDPSRDTPLSDYAGPTGPRLHGCDVFRYARRKASSDRIPGQRRAILELARRSFRV